MSEVGCYVNGFWRGLTGTIEVVNPATEEILATTPESPECYVADALRAASAAQPRWAQSPITHRGDVLRLFADALARERDHLTSLLVAEVGKPRAQAAAEVQFALDFLRYNAGWDRMLAGEILSGDVPGEVIHLLREPVGVVATICPWNFPLAVLCRKLAPALLTGNTVVIKPSEIAPLTIIEAVRIADQHLGLEPGVINLVTGGPDVGRVLVRSGITSMVSFTGHRDTGKAVMQDAASHLTRVALELGGKAPAIVWADADLELAVTAIVSARHTNAGQVCTAAERVFVHADVLEEFTERYVARVDGLVVGDPRGTVDMGPLVSRGQLHKVRDALKLATDEGASVVAGGGRPDGDEFERGYWFSPTVLRDVRADMAVMNDETFGPITPIIGITSLREAVRLANESRYGLSAYLFSADYSTVMATAADLEFGEIYINRTLGESVHAHHSGYKESGIGGEDGKWGLLKYTQIKTVYHHYGSMAAADS
jgi:lactaldehyde dehydrogenase/glycolaldehyde dehydrogenase